jgi:hypothetical protein
MKKREFERLARTLFPNAPEFKAKGNLLFVAPIGSILRGFCFESSSYSATSFRVYAFVQPMYIPLDLVTIGLGFEVSPGPRNWQADEPNLAERLRETMLEQAMPFLRCVGSPADVPHAVEWLRTERRAGGSLGPEAAAYSYAYAGDAAKAREALTALVESCTTAIKGWEAEGTAAPEWLCRKRDRALLLISDLTHDAAAAVVRLQCWDRETIRNLRLEEFR